MTETGENTNIELPLNFTDEIIDIDIINIKNKSNICQEYGCEKQPSFNTEGEKIGIYCNNHKKNRNGQC